MLFFERVDNVTTIDHNRNMASEPTTAETHIHLRARADDKALIDQVAGMMGVNRSQFLLSAAVKEAKAYLVDQTTFYADADSFNAVLDWMDRPASEEEKAGMKRLLDRD